jgi:hypothetical protein
MGTINYFFELHDDIGDSRVDREGILRMSEALLFLSRRGLEGTLSPSNSSLARNGFMDSMTSSGSPMPTGSINERFLGSVSAFIRRCFEYADPDHPRSQEVIPKTKSFQQHQDASLEDEPQLASPDAFAIGDTDDEDEDLLTMDSPSGSPKPARAPPHIVTHRDFSATSSVPFSSLTSPADNNTPDRRRVSKAQSEKANIALDPSNPLHITLPTFRMVVLADELLEQFFESSFPASFHIIDGLETSSSPFPGASSSLTTFSSLGITAGRTVGAALGVPVATSPGAAGATPAAGRGGIRGVLDNIVTDGMRFTAEVRRRMEEAQRELEMNATPGGQGQREEDDDDDDDVPGFERTLTSSNAAKGK